VHVELLTQQAFYRFDQARVPGQLRKRLAVHAGGKVGTYGVFAFFTHVVVVAASIQFGRDIVQVLCFF
jgi:hypothetical protein